MYNRLMADLRFENGEKIASYLRDYYGMSWNIEKLIYKKY